MADFVITSYSIHYTKLYDIKEGNLTRITMTNPYYFVHSYFNGKANVESIKYITWRVDSLARSALNVFSSTPLTYGVDMSRNNFV